MQNMRIELLLLRRNSKNLNKKKLPEIAWHVDDLPF